MKYLSVCSGIEAASVAWHPLGWKPLAFSEIEPFPRAVLAHHYPDVPCHGDFTALREQPWIVDADLLVGGTPCQAFSLAGKRASLADDRGNLTLQFVRLADAIDDLRCADGRDPSIVVWENVPGVLSVRDNAFGCFLAGLVGEDSALVPPRGKWTNAGMVVGPERAAAWRILDAQYFGVAQRRRRLFVVASARKGFDPGEVLFEWEGVRRDHPPRREAQESVAGCLRSGTPGSGGQKTDFEQVVANAVPAHPGLCGPDYTNYVAHNVHGDISPPLRAGGNRTGGDRPPGTDVDTAESLIPVALHCRDLAQTITSNYGKQVDNSDTALGPNIVAFRWQNDTSGIVPDDCAASLKAKGTTTDERSVGAYVAFHPTQDPISSTDGTTHAMTTGSSGGQATIAVASAIAVRRLTPRECERLQGFPDDYTLIPWRGKQSADAPRYKALGNSMAVPVMRWIGRSIQKVLA